MRVGRGTHSSSEKPPQPILGSSKSAGPKLCGSNPSTVVSRRLTLLSLPLSYPAGTSRIGISSAQNSRMTCRQLPHGETGCATSLETNLQCEWNLAGSTSRRSEDDVRIERERNERADTFALHAETGSAMGGRIVRGHTTAFTIAVRSAQIVAPVTYITSRVSDHPANNTGGLRAKDVP